MTKVQKTWLWVFGAMVVVPEVLWSPVINLYYEFFQSSYSGYVKPFNNNFLQNSDNLKYLKFVISLQFIGAVLFFMFWIINKKSVNSKLWFWIILFASLFVVLVSFLAAAFIFTFHPDFIL